ncbi:hypothetical protein F1654_01020 [Alkalicaulis satelles]|uniref:Uncharacterized protein n=1 Tax=Alkalicaulis satelles TaxID=2609175 RepID=A0A5M6ZJV7_9PROT|nr:DUF6624 domain-containing protein [Alkalicaulis satelles]KAA5804620.1 hypothetical protein F1654_01020 [Alkalicaulis satelles]
MHALVIAVLALTPAASLPEPVETRIEAIASGELAFWESGLEAWRFGDEEQQALYEAFEAETLARAQAYAARVRADRNLPEDTDQIIGCQPAELIRLSAARQFSGQGENAADHAEARAEAMPLITQWHEAHANLMDAPREADTAWGYFINAAEQENDPVLRELLIRAARDQYARGLFGAFTNGQASPGARSLLMTANMHLVCTTDRDNTPWLATHVRAGRWFTITDHGSTAAQAAWVIAQHADHDPEFQRQALTLIEPLAREGDIRQSEFALLFDRVLVNMGQPQIYGTRGSCVDGQWTARPIQDEAGLDERRAQMGLQPMEAYIARFANSCP